MTSSSSSSSPPPASSPGDDETVNDSPHSTLDLVGEVCPFTFVKTKLALEAMPMDATLRVIVDHEPATQNIPRSAREWGQDVLAVRPIAEQRWAIDLRKRVR